MSAPSTTGVPSETLRPSPASERATADRVRVAARLVRVRTPLAAVQLVAGQLLAGSPESARLGQRLGDAVAEIDRSVTEALTGLVPARPSVLADVRAVLERVRARVAPSLAARGVAWIPAEPDGEALEGPAQASHESAIALAADLAGQVPRGTRFRISARANENDEAGLCLAVVAPDGRAPLIDVHFARSEELALRFRGRIERTDGTITLWLPRFEQAS